MTSIERLVEQHIVEHESRLKHIDELIERAGAETSESTPAEISDQLASLRHDRDRLANFLEGVRRKARDEIKEEEVEKLGPMIMWESVAEKLEKLVERIQR